MLRLADLVVTRPGRPIPFNQEPGNLHGTVPFFTSPSLSADLAGRPDRAEEKPSMGVHGARTYAPDYGSDDRHWRFVQPPYFESYNLPAPGLKWHYGSSQAIKDL